MWDRSNSYLFVDKDCLWFLVSDSFLFFVFFTLTQRDNQLKRCEERESQTVWLTKFVIVHACLVAQSCSTPCDAMKCSPPGPSFQGILQRRILEWVTISFFRGSSWHRDWTWISCFAGGFFIIWATREDHLLAQVIHNNGLTE